MNRLTTGQKAAGVVLLMISLETFWQTFDWITTPLLRMWGWI